ncbi:cytochrome c biogenesis CcdA family protein [Actinomadura kijaniata]|uniref:cytochrome c biogenesis CcdA family protein n=1 Tax=Actinomadura kijaniata TaxID=46161 RepID=UPI003F1AB451
MTDIGYPAAFLGGALALFSPCGALLLPAFLAYSITAPVTLLTRTGAFYAGLATTLVPLGAAGAVAGRLFNGHREQLVTAGGVLLVALGAAQILGRGFAPRRAREAAGRIRPTGHVSTYLLGTVHGLAGFCAGPILGSILTVAAVGGNAVYGGVLMALYALGMALPLFALALLWDRFDLGRRRWLRGRAVTVGRLRLHTTSLLSGLMFVALGVLFLATEGTAGLPSPIGADREAGLERWARGVGGAVPDVAFVLALAAVGGGVRLARRRSGRPGGRGRAPVAGSDR